MRRVGIFNCPPVKINDRVEFIYNCCSIEQYNYKCRVKGKVIYIGGDIDILIELPQNFKKVGDIKGWMADENEEKEYRCCKNKLYWWATTYRKIENNLEIE